MARLIQQNDELAAANTQLVGKVQALELQLRNQETYKSTTGAVGNKQKGSHLPLYDRMDTIALEDNNPNDSKVNKLLLEAMFAMARMVESSVIQTSKELMDSLENQYEGSEIRSLVNFVSLQVFGVVFQTTDL